MKIMSRGVIPKPLDDRNFRSNTFPAIEILPNGRWLAGFKAAEIKGDCPFQHAVMCWSDDQGSTWSEVFEPVKLPEIDGVSGLSRLLYFVSLGGSRVLMVINWMDASDMSQPYYNPENESLKDTRIFVSISEDNGITWSVPKLMNVPEVNGPVPLTGPPLRLADGTLVCQFEINKYDWDKTPWIHKSALVYSYDEGKTWKDTVIVTGEIGMYYWDQRPALLSDGVSLVDFFWTLDGYAERYINIHAKTSHDGGRHWDKVFDTGIYGQPGQPVDLGDGRLATISINRTSSPVITVRITEDHGHTYIESLVIYERRQEKIEDSKSVTMNGAWAEMAAFSVGHPGLIRLNDHEILAFYYAGKHTDETNIEFVKISVN